MILLILNLHCSLFLVRSSFTQVPTLWFRTVLVPFSIEALVSEEGSMGISLLD